MSIGIPNDHDKLQQSQQQNQQEGKMQEQQQEENINVVGVNILRQNGVDVNEIVKLLVYNASVEFTAYYYFTNLRMHCTGLDGESINGVIEDARMEDLSHF